MQTSKRQLQQLQMIMMALGFYSGRIDGIWSAKSIEAKKNWECSGKFNPAYPNNGLPFADTDPVPAGMRFDRVTRLFNHRALTESMIAQYLGNNVTSKVEAAPVIEKVEVASTIPEGAEQSVEVKDVGVKVEEKPAQHHQHQHKHHKHNR